MDKCNIAKLITAFVILMMGPSACTSKTPPPPFTKITVRLAWIHNAQFAGFYAADHKGYYAAEGLAVTLVSGGAEANALPSVLDGTAQFGVANAGDLILARAKGQPLRAIAINYRRSPIVFIARADSGITRPQDFVGKKIRIAANLDLTLHAVMAHVGIRRDQYTAVVLPTDIALFASGNVPVWTVYLNAMVLELERAGYKLNIIYPDDYGVHFYADTVFTTDDLVYMKMKNNPILLKTFTIDDQLGS